MKLVFEMCTERKIDKKKGIRMVLLLLTSLTAILIVSFTLGKEWYEGKSQSLLSFALIHFSGYLFFLLMPVEVAFIYYLKFFNLWEMITIAIGTAISAQIVDYLIGVSVSSAVINNLVGEKRILKAEKYILKYGNLTIFIFNLFPLSSSVISVAAGMLKYRFRNFFMYSLLGLMLKYFMLSLFFQ
ncbi:VTT domain-containing protein [Maribellus sp. YY47]|uniref:DedA family protein n=1 Tax=Maribellus sp. YY47 TaxID=2929486 RepID=UPI002000A67F|nr:VTT domain-containing protein [Maribellus sp. YY47]MCK3682955.1 VTT domain-containing protein [Maribellus sp. YY47]